MKPLACLIALLFTASLHAQTDQGRFMLSLHNFAPVLSENSTILAPTNSFGIGFGTVKNDANGFETEDSYFNFGINGSGHYFIVDNFSAGLNLNFFNSTTTDEDDDEFSTSIFMAGPELRYYFPVGVSKIYLKGGASWGTYGTKFNGDETSDPDNLSQYGGGLGFAMFPSNNFAINIGASYNVFTDTYESELGEATTTTSGLAIDLGFSVLFGGTE